MAETHPAMPGKHHVMSNRLSLPEVTIDPQGLGSITSVVLHWLSCCVGDRTQGLVFARQILSH